MKKFILILLSIILLPITLIVIIWVGIYLKRVTKSKVKYHE